MELPHPMWQEKSLKTPDPLSRMCRDGLGVRPSTWGLAEGLGMRLFYGPMHRWRRRVHLSQVCSLAEWESYTLHTGLKRWTTHFFRTALNCSHFYLFCFFQLSRNTISYDILICYDWAVNKCIQLLWGKTTAKTHMREKRILLVWSLVRELEGEEECWCVHPEQPLHPQWTHSTILPCWQNQEGGR